VINGVNIKNVSRKSGFTLLEVVIVMLIIAVLVGGFEFVEELLKSIRQKTAIVEVERLEVSWRTFTDEYNFPAGDLAKASEYWPNCAVPATDCDGDGDRRILLGTESYRLWQHLSLAGKIEGSYSGVPSAPDFVEVGVNVPKSQIPGGAYSIGYSAMFGNKLILGAAKIPSSHWASNALLTPYQAQQIDVKKDDGMPITGKVRGASAGLEPCEILGVYNFSTEEIACALWFTLPM